MVLGEEILDVLFGRAKLEKCPSMETALQKGCIIMTSRLVVGCLFIGWANENDKRLKADLNSAKCLALGFRADG